MKDAILVAVGIAVGLAIGYGVFSGDDAPASPAKADDGGSRSIWPMTPCPPPEGQTVQDKLQAIIDAVNALPEPVPMADECKNKATELMGAQPTDPIGGAVHVSRAADNAADGEWVLCKGELDAVH